MLDIVGHGQLDLVGERPNIARYSFNDSFNTTIRPIFDVAGDREILGDPVGRIAKAYALNAA